MAKHLPLIRTLIALLVGLVGVLLVLYAWRLPPFYDSIETTEDAYMRGQVTLISPQLAGYVTEVSVSDFQAVKAGDLLVRIDDRIYTHKLKQAQADLAIQKATLSNADQDQRAAVARIASAEAHQKGAQATLDTAQRNTQRIASLEKRGVSSHSAADDAHAAEAQALAALGEATAAIQVAREDEQAIVVRRQSLAASIARAEAAVHLAEIDLENTRITAPQDGRLGEIGVKLGQYVGAGTQLMALVPQRLWVIANFKEAQLYGMRVGQPASIAVDALDHATLMGHIESFSPATGSEFSVLKPDNATGNFTKVAQRLPIRIALDPGQPLASRLVPGMSVVVSIDTETSAAPSEDGPLSPSP